MTNWNDDRLDDLSRRVDTGFADVNTRFVRLEGEVKEGFERVDERLKGMDKRFSAIDQSLVRMDERFEAMDQRFDQVDKRLDRFEDKIERLVNSIMITGGAFTAAIVVATVFG